MPIIRIEQAPLEEEDGKGPNGDLGPYSARLLSDAGGLTQFGAFIETLPPGSRSSRKHWHEREDEFVHVLEGVVTLHEGDTVTDMHPGDSACFKAGTPAGHCLENRSAAPVSYLVVGTRSPDDVVHYSDEDLRLTKVNFVKHWADKAGNPVKR